MGERGLLKLPAPPALNLPAASPPHQRDSPDFMTLHSLWQHIQELLRGGPPPQPADPGARIDTPPPAKQAVPPLPSFIEEKFKPEKEKRASPVLVVHCLGSFRVYKGEQLLEKWPSHKSKAIFKYLLIHRAKPIHQEVLMELFWPDSEPETARRNLYQAIYTLRQTLQSGGPNFPYILCEESCYLLNLALALWVDSEAFMAHYQAGKRLEQEGHLRQAVEEYELAETLYEGEFLAEDIYEEWSLVDRENLKHAHLDILDRLGQYYFDQEQFPLCIVFCQKLLLEDNCREDAHRRLMQCYLRQGQRHLALHQYHRCVEVLKQELDTPPMPSTTELYRQIQANQVQFPQGPKLREKTK
jgi:DNA-binding SARP family transcriptional activator